MSAPRLSAGIVVVRCIGGRYHYLLLRAYRYWDFPKGLVEPNESPLAAARRETEEETGLRGLELAWGEDHVETPPYRGNKVARYYLARSDSGDVVLGINPVLGRPEHHAYTWADYATAASLLGPRVRAVLEWAHARTGERC
ncbi:MAG TPA: NUDIX domain-containing protein [Burkholderiales bacterium]